jgi:hypothetical protein
MMARVFGCCYEARARQSFPYSSSFGLDWGWDWGGMGRHWRISLISLFLLSGIEFAWHGG